MDESVQLFRGCDSAMRFEVVWTCDGEMESCESLMLRGMAVSESPGLMHGGNPDSIAASRSRNITVAQTRLRISTSQADSSGYDDGSRCRTMVIARRTMNPTSPQRPLEYAGVSTSSPFAMAIMQSVRIEQRSGRFTYGDRLRNASAQCR